MRLLYTSAMFLCSCLLFAQADSLLVNTVWEETSGGERNGYVLQLDQYGTFEEDAGRAYKRSSQYLMGRWTVDSTGHTITFAVDYFLGKNMVPGRYRDGRDFYLTYSIISLDRDSLALEDVLTGDFRSFVRTRLKEGHEDAATRRIPKGGKKKGGFKLPELGRGGKR
ncbi:hypothetical protein [Neolewinella persica]|uniref:hypothetical protein n=1 Tax=Neolewinella persica TaxID=70998 RepID=UPI00039B2138|nr:hypothetical protein [Neolewinella persica]